MINLDILEYLMSEIRKQKSCLEDKTICSLQREDVERTIVRTLDELVRNTSNLRYEIERGKHREGNK